MGGFDERFFMNSEEIDLQRRLRERGVRVVALARTHRGARGRRLVPIRSPDDAGSSQGQLTYADKWASKRRLQAALIAATAANFAVNATRRAAGRDVHPVEVARCRAATDPGRPDDAPGRRLPGATARRRTTDRSSSTRSCARASPAIASSWPGGDVVLAAPQGGDVRPGAMGLGTQYAIARRPRLRDRPRDHVARGTRRRSRRPPPPAAAAAARRGGAPRRPLGADRRVHAGGPGGRPIGAGGSRPRVAGPGRGRRDSATPKRYEEWVGRARGIQCNGYPAHDRFARHSLLGAPLLRHPADRRPRAAWHATVRRTEPRTPFRLCFSGRLIEAKGPQHALAAADRLRASGVDCTLDVIGVGPLEQQLRRSAGPHVRFLEGMDFARGLDLLRAQRGRPHGAAAHPGRPERHLSRGRGLRRAGRGLRQRRARLARTPPRHRGRGAARATTTRSPRAVAGIVDDPARWAELRDNGLRFMDEHAFENESDRRVDAPREPEPVTDPCRSAPSMRSMVRTVVLSGHDLAAWRARFDNGTAPARSPTRWTRSSRSASTSCPAGGRAVAPSARSATPPSTDSATRCRLRCGRCPTWCGPTS